MAWRVVIRDAPAARPACPLPCSAARPRARIGFTAAHLQCPRLHAALVYTLPRLHYPSFTVPLSFTLVLVSPRLHCPRLHPPSRLHSLPLPLVYTLSRLHQPLVYTRYHIPSFTLPLVYTILVYTLSRLHPASGSSFYRDRSHRDKGPISMTPIEIDARGADLSR